jgi:hypothetical protein
VLDSCVPSPIKAEISGRLTRILPYSAKLAAEYEGDLKAMTTRHKISAIGQAAATAKPAAALILGSLLLLIRP